MDLGLEGRVALVTGASKGIGRAVATALAAEGAKVALASRSRERIEAAAAEVGGTGFAHDTADVDAAPRLVDRVEEELGPVDVLVTNSGGPPIGADALAFTREQWEEAYRMLVLGPMALVERVMPGMRERRFGRVLSVSSSAVREPIPVLMLSNAHRSGLLAAFKTISRQVAGDGVTLNSVLPGRIATDRLADNAGSLDAAEAAAREQVPAGRLGTVEEMAAAAAFLCSEPASYITGQALLVDGGLTQST
jgi:3-oxoacyl-[acyl-carrier protein] reductase